jgi:catechol 2,3-dioxygenase-like lactoylglutathione lyase family enzyme
MPMVRKVQGVLCPVRDLARAKAFYGETLGLPLREEDPEGRWVEFGPPRGPGILLYQGAAGSGGGAMFPGAERPAHPPAPEAPGGSGGRSGGGSRGDDHRNVL